MPFCAAINCTNHTPNYEGVSFHSFPCDPGLCKKWVIAMRRDKFKPTKHSTLCSKHFEEDCFELSYRLKKAFGLDDKPLRRRLKPGVCPSLFSFPTTSNIEASSSNIIRGAYNKRRLVEMLVTDEGATPKTARTSCKPTDVSETMSMDVQLEAEAVCKTTSSECQTEPPTTYNAETQYAAPRQVRHFKCQYHVHVRSKATQTEIPLIDVKEIGIQVDLPKVTKTCDGPEIYELNEEDEEDEEDEDGEDEEWVPHGDDIEPETTDDDFVNEEGNVLRDDSSPVEEKKFIVFESCLLELLKTCFICFHSNCDVFINAIRGSFVLIVATCPNGHSRNWFNQPLHRGLPLGNLLLAAASLFSGCQPAKCLNLFKHCNIKSISARTYFKIQSSYLCPAVKTMWTTEQGNLIEERKGCEISLGGDGRCCSPGHTAKYGSYSLMDLKDCKVIETQLVQSSEVKNSVAMELEGLQRCFKNLDELNLTVKALTTDRHVQVKKYMREQKPSIVHQFDVWHVAKGLKKKLDQVGKKKGLEVVGRWSKSVSNHLYWCASSSESGLEIAEKWRSVLNHICDIHRHPELETFQECQHGPLDDREWLQKGSRAYMNIEEVLTKTLLVKDIQKLASRDQTSALESFHNLICFFAPKHDHFFFEAMESRVLLAVLHFNENACREQSQTKSGEKRWGITYSKSNQGKPVPREIKIPVTYGYVKQLMECVYARRMKFPSYKTAREQKCLTIPAPVSCQYEKMDKMTVVSNHVSRFKK